jgi:hypothetical protein
MMKHRSGSQAAVLVMQAADVRYPEHRIECDA